MLGYSEKNPDVPYPKGPETAASMEKQQKVAETKRRKQEIEESTRKAVRRDKLQQDRTEARAERLAEVKESVLDGCVLEKLTRMEECWKRLAALPLTSRVHEAVLGDVGAYLMTSKTGVEDATRRAKAYMQAIDSCMETHHLEVGWVCAECAVGGVDHV